MVASSIDELTAALYRSGATLDWRNFARAVAEISSKLLFSRQLLWLRYSEDLGCACVLLCDSGEEIITPIDQREWPTVSRQLCAETSGGIGNVRKMENHELTAFLWSKLPWTHPTPSQPAISVVVRPDQDFASSIFIFEASPISSARASTWYRCCLATSLHIATAAYLRGYAANPSPNRSRPQELTGVITSEGIPISGSPEFLTQAAKARQHPSSSVFFQNAYKSTQIQCGRTPDGRHFRMVPFGRLREVTIRFTRRVDRLTRRERQCVIGTTLGLRQKEIADQLDVAPSTVGTLTQRAQQKLGVETRSALREIVSTEIYELGSIPGMARLADHA